MLAGVMIQKVEGPGLIQFDCYISKRTNLHCTGIGKVLVAYAAQKSSTTVASGT